MPGTLGTWIYERTGVTGDGGGGGVLTKATLYREVPMGAINGTNKQFYLHFIPDPDYSLLLMLNGDTQYPARNAFDAGPIIGYEYTLASNVITYSMAPQPGDRHDAYYFKGDPIITGPPTSVIATVVTSCTAQASYLPVIEVSAGDNCTGAWYKIFFDTEYGSLINEGMSDAAGWTNRISTLDVSTLTTAQLSTMQIAASIIGTVFGDGLTTLTIHDCYLKFTYPGGGVLLTRYTSVNYNAGSAGTAGPNPLGEPRLTRSHYSGLGDPPFCTMQGFGVPS